MNQAIVQSSGGITLVGGGPVASRLFQETLEMAPTLVAADGGADRCRTHGTMPSAVVGDMDSISAPARDWVGADRLHRIAEQETTDFDKALRSVAAPFVLGLGFLGGYVDHELAVFSALVQSRAACILLGARDAVFHVPRVLSLELRRGDRFSLFPLAPLSGQSEGLDWPLDGLLLSAAGRIGTSNRVTDGPVRVRMSGPGCLCIVPRARVAAVIAGIRL